MARVAVVTGGASGIGRATADLLQARGDQVAVFDRVGGGADAVDVRDEHSIADAVAHVRETMGPIDIVVNAAGIAAGGPIDALDFVDTWRETLDVNLTGAMLVVRACLDDLVASNTGRIVNVASTEALAAGRSTSPYTVSKHGLLGFTRSLAVDLGRLGITANCVCPGATVTGMTAVIPEPDRNTFARRNIPVGRYGRPEEIAFVIAALTAVEASFVNGAVIAVDGGMTAQAR